MSTGEQVDQAGAVDPVDPVDALLLILEDIRITTDALIDSYYRNLMADPPVGLRLRRWQRRVLSAMRAAGKARAKTDVSIRKLKRDMDGGG